MPFKSEAQRRAFAKLVAEGKMSQSVFDEWNKESPDKLPERVGGAQKKIKKVKVIK